MDPKLMDVIEEMRASLLEALKSRFRGLIEACRESARRTPVAGILECRTPWGGYVLAPESLLRAEGMPLEIYQASPNEDFLWLVYPKPALSLSFAICFGREVFVAFYSDERGRFPHPYSGVEAPFYGSVYTWIIGDSFLLVGGDSITEYVDSEFKYATFFQPSVVRVLRGFERRVIEEFAREYVERLVTSLSVFLREARKGTYFTFYRRRGGELSRPGEMLKAFEEHSWYAITMANWSTEELEEFRKSVEVRDFPSYVLAKLLSEEGWEEVADGLLTVLRTEIVRGDRFYDDFEWSVSRELLEAIVLEHPLLLHGLLRWLLFPKRAEDPIEDALRLIAEVRRMLEKFRRAESCQELWTELLRQLYPCEGFSSEDQIACGAAVRVIARLLNIPPTSLEVMPKATVKAGENDYGGIGLGEIAKKAMKIRLFTLMDELYFLERLSADPRLKDAVLGELMSAIRELEDWEVDFWEGLGTPDSRVLGAVLPSLKTIIAGARREWKASALIFLTLLGLDPCGLVRDEEAMRMLVRVLSKKLRRSLRRPDPDGKTPLRALVKAARCSKAARIELMLLTKEFAESSAGQRWLALLKESAEPEAIPLVREIVLDALEGYCIRLYAMLLFEADEEEIAREIERNPLCLRLYESYVDGIRRHSLKKALMGRLEEMREKLGLR